METLVLKADANILAPFEMMAKQFGVNAEYVNEPQQEDLIQTVAEKVGLDPEEITSMIVSAVIKECRREEKSKKCA